MSSAPAQPLDDAAARQAALDPRRSLLVQAPAGSGKTGLLVQRFLALLAGVEEPEQVRALTFTRKAALEMRDRLLESLRQAGGAPPEEDYKRTTWELARAAMAQSERRGWGLLETPARLRLSTIDALCAELAARMPWLSRCGPSPSPREDADTLYSEAAQNTLALLESDDAIAADLRLLAGQRHGDCETLADRMADMLARREQWLPLLTETKDAPEELARRTNAALAAAGDAAREHARRCLLDCRCGDELLAIAAECARNLAATEPHNPICHCRGLGALPGTSVTEMPAWQGLATLLLKKDGGRRVQVRQSEGFPNGAAELKQRFESLALTEAAVGALAALRTLPEPLTESEQAILAATQRVLLRLAVELELVFQRRGQLDFIAVAGAARVALGAGAEPTALAFALDGELKHLLVDEFQDISHGQFDLLEALLQDWQANDGRTLFLVGDPMQSIYGFRNADVTLFELARSQGIANVRLEFQPLSTNFRSRPGLIDWFNQVFEPSFAGAGGAVAYAPMTAPPRRDPERPAVAASAGAGSASAAATTAPVSRPYAYHVIAGGTRWQEARTLRARIEELTAQMPRPDGKIAILARNRTHLDAILAELDRAGAAYEARGLLTLDASPVIQDLLALTRALLHPADRIAWLALLRAPWCGLTLADLHALCADAPRAAVWELLQDPERLARLSPHGRGRAAWLRDTLAPAWHARGRVAPRALIEYCWRRLGGADCAGQASHLDHAGEFLSLLEAATAGGDIADPDALAEQASQLFQRRPPAAASAPIVLLTMHEAKGLEFECVLLPSLARRGRRNEARLLYWERMRIGGAWHTLVAPAAPTGQTNSAAAFLRGRAEVRRAEEELRVLYVAATRAKYRLDLLAVLPTKQDGEMRRPEQGTLLQRVWPAMEAEVRPIVANAMAAPAMPEAPPLRRVAADWRPAPPAASVAMAAPAIEPAATAAAAPWRAAPLTRQIGTAVHQMLRRMGERNSPEWSAAALDRALIDAGVAPAGMEKARRRAARALEAVRRGSRGRWILQPHAQARCEYALTGIVAGQLREVVVDRTFVDDAGIRWIIDYKTAEHEGADREAFLDQQQQIHRDQLQTYAALLAAGGHPVCCALYFPLLDAWREWPA